MAVAKQCFYKTSMAVSKKSFNKNILAHKLNGSSLAVGRTMVAIMFQELSEAKRTLENEDGSIDILEVLKPLY